MTDETSKFGKQFIGYEAADEEGNIWVLGLHDIETKSAADTLTVLWQILQDLDDRARCTTNSVSHYVLQHISATMSDRAATEVKFNDILETHRKELLPVVYENWDTLNDEEQKSVGTMCNFFCGLHSLVNVASKAH